MSLGEVPKVAQVDVGDTVKFSFAGEEMRGMVTAVSDDQSMASVRIQIGEGHATKDFKLSDLSLEAKASTDEVEPELPAAGSSRL
eukprot:3023356-Pyramimonas_sp.AAC.1